MLGIPFCFYYLTAIVTSETHIEAWNKAAPWWAGALVLFMLTGLLTSCIDLGSFWKGYMLDVVCPAWNYILFRTRFTARQENWWTRFFTPVKTFVLFAVVCIGIESAQFFNLYDATYDTWDFVAYFSLLFPLFLIDLFLLKKGKQ